MTSGPDPNPGPNPDPNPGVNPGPNPGLNHRKMPMFPLGSVLFPGQLLPLQIFEPRYHVMMTEVLAHDGQFGVVLIDRGSEVGGGDHRTDVGCVATVEEARVIDESRVGIVARGSHRVRINEWLADDPYPAAMVEPVIDRERTAEIPPATMHACRSQLERLVALVAPGTQILLPELAPRALADHVSARFGFGPFDAQRLLATYSAIEQFDVLNGLLADAIAFIELQRSSPLE